MFQIFVLVFQTFQFALACVGWHKFIYIFLIFFNLNGYFFSFFLQLFEFHLILHDYVTSFLNFKSHLLGCLSLAMFLQCFFKIVHAFVFEIKLFFKFQNFLFDLWIFIFNYFPRLHQFLHLLIDAFDLSF